MEVVKMLSEMSVGKKGRIKKVVGAGALKRRLLDMGIIPGSELEVMKLAPLGDPVDVKVKGYHLSLRKKEAEHISVEVSEV